MIIYHKPDRPRPHKHGNAEIQQKKTRQLKFMETYPRAELDEYGVLDICPKYIDKFEKCPAERCRNCKREFWLKEEQEVKND